MKRTLIVAACALGVFAVTGWLAWHRYVAVLTKRSAARHRPANHLPDDALRALASDPGLTLFSIDSGQGDPNASTAPTFRGWSVLGQTTVSSPEQRRQLIDTLQLGCSRWSGHEIAACFNPRHAIRATDGSRTFDFLICFECGRLYYYPPDSGEQHLNIRVHAGPFHDILAAAGIPIARQPQSE